MSSLLIRKATSADFQGLSLMLAELGYPAEQSSFKERFTKFLSQNGYGVTVVLYDNDLAGFIAWSKSLVFVIDSIRIHIEGILVRKKYRGLGIGKKLMQHVEEIAKANSPAIIDLTSGLRREKDGTHEFYKKLGYKNEGYMAKLYLRKKL